MGRPEASIENYLAKRVKEEGGEIRKVSWIGRKGAPDRLVWWQGPRYAWCECKAPGEQVDWRSNQGREIRRMWDDGWEVYVLSSREEVDAMIEKVKGG
ncbi:MAG: VRR-NUC domain-containing protein [Patescibacteria group bacterium]|nr:VRR-NUC domain-containing protein [Patescibacteria group bacterium]